MSSTLIGQGLITEYGNLTSSSPTQIMLRDGAVLINSIICTEIAGGTPSLTVEVYSPSTASSYFLRNQTPLTAKQTVIYDEQFVIQNGDYLRLTSSAALGQVSFFVTYFNPDSAHQR